MKTTIQEKKSKDYSFLLHKSLDVVNDKSTIIGNQFIVNVDNKNERLTVYCNDNPENYREFTLPFSYLNHLYSIDGDGNRLKLTVHRRKTINRKLEEYNTWKKRNSLS